MNTQKEQNLNDWGVIADQLVLLAQHKASMTPELLAQFEALERQVNQKLEALQACLKAPDH